MMKRFEELFAELKKKAENKDPNSGTVQALDKGKHFIGKKILEEAGEVWMASEYEGQQKTAEEISQLLYHVQVMMIACGLELDDVYKYL
jgi:phosphoribosyl-ATP pyrophosphohydrolase